MKVLERFTINGRGEAVVVDALPDDLFAGMNVAYAVYEYAPYEFPFYTVIGIETHAMPRSHTNGKPAGLLLRGDQELPKIGDALMVVVDETYYRVHERHKIAAGLRTLTKAYLDDVKAITVINNAANLVERGRY